MVDVVGQLCPLIILHCLYWDGIFEISQVMHFSSWEANFCLHVNGNTDDALQYMMKRFSQCHSYCCGRNVAPFTPLNGGL